ncbi:MAG: N-acetyltransferase [bacterium]|nr:N-acetyltransferase [bacterium]
MIREAKPKDVVAIQKLINSFAKDGKMLPRSLNEIYENVRDFFVAEAQERIIGCVALHITWDDLAEIRSLAVDKEFMGQGIGKGLLQAGLSQARQLGIRQVFTLTYEPDFFEANSFKRIDKSELPHKVWGDCVRCVKFPDCNEIPLMISVDR